CRRGGPRMNDPKTPRRVAALASLVLFFGAAVLAVIGAVDNFPRGLIALGCIVVGALAAWHGALRRGVLRVAGLVGGAVGVAGAVGFGAAILVRGHHGPLEEVIVVAALRLSLGSAREAFRVRVELPPRPAPSRPVLFYNPKSGGGKAERFALADEARKRGIEP